MYYKLPLHYENITIFFQKTYERIPTADEAHLHVMNTINCPLVFKLRQNSELLGAHDIETSLNSVIYDLKPETYQVEVKQSSQLKECRGLQKTEFEFEGHAKEVISALNALDYFCRKI